MTMLDPAEVDRLERSRRRAIRLLWIVLGLSSVFCLFLVVAILNPPAQRTEVAPVSDFVPGETVLRSVRQLNVSETLARRPDISSEDPVYITRYEDGSWRAVLAWDGASGCIVNYDAATDGFADPCEGSLYDAAGRVQNSQRNLRLGVLPVEIEGDTVYVRDEFIEPEL